MLFFYYRIVVNKHKIESVGIENYVFVRTRKWPYKNLVFSRLHIQKCLKYSSSFSMPMTLGYFLTTNSTTE